MTNDYATESHYAWGQQLRHMAEISGPVSEQISELSRQASEELGVNPILRDDIQWAAGEAAALNLKVETLYATWEAQNAYTVMRVREPTGGSARWEEAKDSGKARGAV